MVDDIADVKRRAWASIDCNALKKNLSQVRALCPDSKIIPVIKANAYGHGMVELAHHLAEDSHMAAGLAVATVDEAIQLSALEIGLPILLLNGFRNAVELNAILEREIEPVIHSMAQVELLEAHFDKEILGGKRRLWLKQNTGMNRLGMNADEIEQAYLRLHKYPDTEFVLLSHFAWADDQETEAAKTLTATQLSFVEASRLRLLEARDEEVPCSVAASAGIYTQPSAHYQYVRPGIMLYGSSPLAGQTGEELGLHPVMTLHARLISINDVAAGQSIGYGATYTCEQDSRVGVVSIGYGDGYPRAAQNGTPVLVQTASGPVRTRLIGRVSMDMITIDLTGIADVKIDDEVILWGEGLCADEVAASAGTIAYELFCQVTARVPRIYR